MKCLHASLVSLGLSLSLSGPLARAQDPAAVALDVEGGVQLTGRHLGYTDDLFHRMRTYDLTAAPGGFARVGFYPGALLGGRTAGMVGLTAGVDGVIAPDSTDDQGRAWGVRAYGYTAGLRVRAPWGPHDVGLDVAYVAQRFTLGQSTPGQDAGVPNVATQSLRLGASGRFDLVPRVALTTHLDYLAVLSLGTAAGLYFPRETAAGMELGVGVAVGLFRHVEVRAALDYRRYFTAMNPVPGDAFIVGGALDQYVTGSVSVAYRR